MSHRVSAFGANHSDSQGAWVDSGCGCDCDCDLTSLDLTFPMGDFGLDTDIGIEYLLAVSYYYD